MPSQQIKESEEAVYLSPKKPATATVIWLHGLGADGNDFVPIVPELELNDLAIRYVFPHAPVRPVTLNMGMRMRAWYDIPAARDMTPASITSLSRRGIEHQDGAGIRDSERILSEFIQRERDAGIPTEKIVLAGFSQGGAIALHTGLRYPSRLAGILALSTYLPLAEQFEAEARPERRDTPILQCHGEFDPMLPIQLGTWSRDVLKEKGYSVEWRQYPMQHQVCADEIEHVGAWLRQRLGGAE